MGKYTWPWSAISPPTVYPGNAGQSGVTVTLNLVSKYEDRLGNKVDWNGGNDLQAKMANLDYRFSQTVVGNLMRWNSEFLNYSCGKIRVMDQVQMLIHVMVVFGYINFILKKSVNLYGGKSRIPHYIS